MLLLLLLSESLPLASDDEDDADSEPFRFLLFFAFFSSFSLPLHGASLVRASLPRQLHQAAAAT